jgi:hypothetical protein
MRFPSPRFLRLRFLHHRPLLIASAVVVLGVPSAWLLAGNLTQFVQALRGYWRAHYALRRLTLFDFATGQPIH